MDNEPFTTAYLCGIQRTRWEELQYTINNINFNIVTEDELKNIIIDLLVIALVDEQLSELNYLHSYNLTRSTGKSDFDPEFQQHELDEREHKELIIKRLRELDAINIFLPISQWDTHNSAGKEWNEEFDTNSIEILTHRLKEEEHAVTFYTMFAEFLRKTQDTSTYTLIKKIKEDEEEHVMDLRDLMREYDQC